MPINIDCWNEYDTLKTVILGSVYDLDNIPKLYTGTDQDAFTKIIEETIEDLENIKLILEQHNIKVLRPKQPKTYSNLLGYIPQKHSPAINVRDFYMAFGNTFFLSYGSYQTRRFETFWLEDIISKMIDDDNIVISANQPNFTEALSSSKDNIVENSWLHTYEDLYKHKNLVHFAGILKHNKIAICRKSIGTPIGIKWIKNLLAQQGIEMYVTSGYGHIDAGTAILRDDLIISQWSTEPHWDIFKNRIQLPAIDKWQGQRYNLEFRQQIKQPGSWLSEWQGHFQEFDINGNMLSLSPDKVLVSFTNKEVYQKLRSFGVEPVYVPWRHHLFWGGGLHCITCDINRES